MMKQIKIKLLLLLLIVILFGCSSNDQVDLFEWDGSFVGDNSAVINLANQLMHHDKMESVALQTTKEPYGIQLVYSNIEANQLEDEYRKTVLYNATYIFTLIDNAELLTFQFDEKTYTLEKTELEKWYGQDLDLFEEEEALHQLLESTLANEEKIIDFFENSLHE